MSKRSQRKKRTKKTGEPRQGGNASQDKNEKFFPKVSDLKKRKFLAAFAETGFIGAAAKLADVTPRAVWNWRNSEEYRDPDFVEAFDAAYRIAAETIEDALIRRARDGVRKKIFHCGEPVIDPVTGEQYEELTYDTTAAIFMLKGAKPERYKDRHELSGPDNGPIHMRTDPKELTDEQLAAIIAKGLEEEQQKND